MNNMWERLTLCRTTSRNQAMACCVACTIRRENSHRQSWCIKGRVLDVAVDLRKDSSTYGKHVMVELSGENKRQFFIPRGFAHGFLVLSDEAIFTYKVDNVYAPQAEASIRWDDEDLNIQWPIRKEDVLTSEKDLKKAKAFKDADSF